MTQALKRYSEDRIGMVDYALESGGVCVRPARPRTSRALAAVGPDEQGLSAEVTSPRTHHKVRQQLEVTKCHPWPGQG